jgi:hypothetical protein
MELLCTYHLQAYNYEEKYWFWQSSLFNTGLFCVLLLIVSNTATAQQGDSIKRPVHFCGTVTTIQNGISLIPSFSLGQPVNKNKV